MNPDNEPDQGQENQKVFKKYAYAAALGLSLCFEVLAAGLLGYFVGAKVDLWLESKAKLGTAFCVIFFMGVSLFHVVKQLERLQKILDKNS